MATKTKPTAEETEKVEEPTVEDQKVETEVATETEEPTAEETEKVEEPTVEDQKVDEVKESKKPSKSSKKSKNETFDHVATPVPLYADAAMQHAQTLICGHVNVLETYDTCYRVEAVVSGFGRVVGFIRR